MLPPLLPPLVAAAWDQLILDQVRALCPEEFGASGALPVRDDSAQGRDRGGDRGLLAGRVPRDLAAL